MTAWFRSGACVRCAIFALCFCAAASAADPVVVVRTEHPTCAQLGDALHGNLAKELGRQAILIAARDEFGLATRDESLGESLDGALGDAAIVADLKPVVRTSMLGGTVLRIEQTVEGELVEITVRLPHGELQVADAYRQLAAEWHEASQRLVEALREAGVEGEPRGPDSENTPAEDIERLLGRMNFVSQYAAVSLAHRSIAERGASAEWLSVLSRAYANLGTLVGHHWNGSPEAFFARSLLYAQRAVSIAPEDDQARWLTPYALSLAGAHASGLAEFERVAAEVAEPPLWATVIGPFCRFQLEELRAVGEGDVSQEELARWLCVCLRLPMGRHRSFNDVARDSIAVSPDAYGAYSGLVTNYPSLGDSRYGAYTGPQALARFALTRLGDVADLPKSLGSEIPSSAEEFFELIARLGDPLPRDPFFPTPRLVIERLREADAGRRAPREPSWGVLASLVEEEQFVMAANYCDALANATESDHSEEIDGLVKTIGEHRYFRHLKLQGVARGEKYRRGAEIYAGFDVPSPRMNMKSMLQDMWYSSSTTESGQRTHQGVWYDARSNFGHRLTSMAEALTSSGEDWAEQYDERRRAEYARRFHLVSPHHPHWLLTEMARDKSRTAEDLREWFDVAGKDATTCVGLAKHLDKSGKPEEALEWLNKAYKLDPTADTTIAIGRLLRRQERFDEWLPSQERFLNGVKSRGLEHSQVQIYVANTFMQEDHDFEKALPYAEAAARTYSGRSLYAAVAANEGLGEFERADHWAHELSESYPTYSGEAWYFFRRRTGFGDAEEAMPFLRQAFDADSSNSKKWSKVTYLLLEGDKERAFEAFHRMGEETGQVYWYFVSAILAVELEDADRAAQEVTTARALARNFKDSYPSYFDAAIACADLIDGGEEAYDEDLIDERLKALYPGAKRDFQFFFGAALQAHSIASEHSDRLLRESVSTQPFDFITGHLAGHYLVRKHGVSRSAPIEPIANPKVKRPSSGE